MRTEKIFLRTIIALLVLFQLTTMMLRILGYIPTANWAAPILFTVVTIWLAIYSWRTTSNWK